jgi:hypothetical protein
MLSRARSSWLAVPGALLLILVLAGGALGATVLTATTLAPESETDPVVTLATWEDTDGDGVDDDCDDAVEADAEAAAAADAAVDADGDGTVSVPEAAHSDRVGGLNCNHGGYVSTVANEAEDADEETEEPAEEPAEEAEADAETCESTETVPEFDPATFTGPGAFGAYVSTVAAMDVVGGKNCNHGGAVSEAVKAAKEAAREAREAEKAQAKAERDAAKAERAAQRAERAAQRAAAKAEREAARAERTAGKSNGKGGGH